MWLALDEVVVIGYGSISKKELTSAVSHISGKDMLQIGSGNPADADSGKGFRSCSREFYSFLILVLHPVFRYVEYPRVQPDWVR